MNRELPQLFNVPFAGNIVPVNTSQYCKDQLGTVMLNFNCRKADGSAMADNEIIATLPAGFRPRADLEVNGVVNTDTGKAACTFLLKNSGEIILLLTNMQNVYHCFLSASFSSSL